MKRQLLWKGSRSIDAYEPIGKIDEGSYGIVYKAKDKKTNEIVAIKKIKLTNEQEGFPITSIREINILFSLNHINIIKYKEILYGSRYDKIYSVMEYIDYELKAVLIQQKYAFSTSNIKSIMKQLLSGIEYIHDKWVIHRDIKSSNILLRKDGVLKIGDFGLARKYSDPLFRYTPLVVTLWYRAPEVLLYCKEYGPSIDIWSCGCIMGEIVLNRPLFEGESELDQLNKIFQVIGTINDKSWPQWETKCGSHVSKLVFNTYSNIIQEIFDEKISDLGIDLITKLLTLDPSKRITAKEALNHAWFSEIPIGGDKCDMDDYHSIKNNNSIN